MKVQNLMEALESGIAPWDQIELKTKRYWVFRDGFPVTEGHLLFVPVTQEWGDLQECWQAAYKWGYNGIQSEKWDAFNIGQNVGAESGQTIMYPHVHLIPRRKGDTENPKGGVRKSVNGVGDY
jgi:ATP adenylyltransferase